MSAWFLGALLVVVPQAEPAPAAMVLKARGAVSLQPAKGPAKPAVAMSLLYPGDVLNPKDDSEVALVIFSDGHKELLKTKAAVTIGPEGCKPADAVERQELPEAQKQAILEGIGQLGRSGRTASVTLRGTGESKTEIPGASPMPRAVVVTGQPLFSWQPVAGAQNYEVKVLDTNRQLLWKAATADPRLPYPAKQKALAQGAVYIWELRTQPAEGPERLTGECTFSVLSEAEAEELAPIEALAKSTDQADLLLAASAYHAYGVYDRALALYERLSQMAPKDAAFQAACAAYYQRAGRPEDAKKALHQAREQGLASPDDRDLPPGGR